MLVLLKTCTRCNGRGAQLRYCTALEPAREVAAMLLQSRKAACACSSWCALDESVAMMRACCGVGEQEGRDKPLLLALKNADARIVNLFLLLWLF